MELKNFMIITEHSIAILDQQEERHIYSVYVYAKISQSISKNGSNELYILMFNFLM